METEGNMGPISVLVSIVIGLVVLIALHSFVPVIGANIEDAMPNVNTSS